MKISALPGLGRTCRKAEAPLVFEDGDMGSKKEEAGSHLNVFGSIRNC